MLLNESGYPRIAQIMRGLIPEIKSFAILTAQNPPDSNFTRQENEERNDKLEQNIRSLGKGFIKVDGKYWFIPEGDSKETCSTENSYFIPNIEREDAIKLGQKFEQQSILFGQRKSVPKGKKEFPKCIMYLIYTRNGFDKKSGKEYTVGKVAGIRRIFNYVSDDNKEIKSYTEIKGIKFTIPFLDKNETLYADWKENSGEKDNEANNPNQQNPNANQKRNNTTQNNSNYTQTEFDFSKQDETSEDYETSEELTESIYFNPTNLYFQ